MGHALIGNEQSQSPEAIGSGPVVHATTLCLVCMHPYADTPYSVMHSQFGDGGRNKVYQSLRGININIIGQIYPGDEQKFARFNYPSGSTLVYLSGLGGDVETAVKIGRMIWDRGYITLVNNNGPCASACTIIWFGGRISTIQRDSFLGFHCPFVPGTHQCSEDGAQYEIAYLKSVGLTDKQAWILTHIASPDDVAIATEAWARKLEFKFGYIPSLLGARSCGMRFCVLLG